MVDSEAQGRQRLALNARELIAFSVFDALIGNMTKPLAAPAAIVGIDPRLANSVGMLYATLPVTDPSRTFTVTSNGLIGDESAHDDTRTICDETVVFFKQIWGTATMTPQNSITEYKAPVEEAKDGKK